MARDLVERDGVPALTLGAVADQAGMARATVYGFFSSRSELLRALERKLPAPEPQEAPETDGTADSDSSSAIWINCQPDLNDFLPEDASPEEEGAKEPPPERRPSRLPSCRISNPRSPTSRLRRTPRKDGSSSKRLRRTQNAGAGSGRGGIAAGQRARCGA